MYREFTRDGGVNGIPGSYVTMLLTPVPNHEPPPLLRTIYLAAAVLLLPKLADAAQTCLPTLHGGRSRRTTPATSPGPNKSSGSPSRIDPNFRPATALLTKIASRRKAGRRAPGGGSFAADVVEGHRAGGVQGHEPANGASRNTCGSTFRKNRAARWRSISCSSCRRTGEQEDHAAPRPRAGHGRAALHGRPRRESAFRMQQVRRPGAGSATRKARPRRRAGASIPRRRRSTTRHPPRRARASGTGRCRRARRNDVLPPCAPNRSSIHESAARPCAQRTMPNRSANGPFCRESRRPRNPASATGRAAAHRPAGSSARCPPVYGRRLAAKPAKSCRPTIRWAASCRSTSIQFPGEVPRAAVLEWVQHGVVPNPVAVNFPTRGKPRVEIVSRDKTGLPDADFWRAGGR